MNAPENRTIIAAAAALAAFIALRRAGAGEEHAVVLRSLLEETDVVLAGTIEDVRSAPGGVWHRLGVAAVIRGEDPGSAVDIYLHGAGIPESVELDPGEAIIVGIRWLSSDGGDFHRRLLASRREAGRAGLAAADAVFRASEERLQEIEAELRKLISLESDAGRARPDRPERLADLAARGHPAIRVEAIRRLAGGGDPLSPEAAAAVRETFAREVSEGGNPAVLHAFLDLMRARRLSGCAVAVCELIFTGGDPILVSEAIDTLASDPSPELMAVIADGYPEASLPAKGRVLRTLARMGWEGTVPLARDAFETGEPDLRLAAVEALGDLPTEESAGFLAEAVKVGPPSIRRHAIVSLARHRTAASSRILEGTLRGRLDARERALIRRAAPAPRIRSGSPTKE